MRRRPSITLHAPLACLALLAGLVSGCDRRSAPAAADLHAATRPAQAVRRLAQYLRDDDLAGFARASVPPALHARLDTAWREGRSRWPLSEWPLGARLPQTLQALATPDAPARLQASFDRQFAGADRELKAAAATLGVFGVNYVQREGDYSPAQRGHYAQVVQALSRWAMRAPLGERVHAPATIAQLTAAARATRLNTPDAFAAAGMQGALRQLGPFFASSKAVLRRYGLDLDGSLAALQATLLQQTGDRAEVRLRYTLAGRQIDTVIALERHDGRWYPSDGLRRAEAAARQPAAPR